MHHTLTTSRTEFDTALTTHTVVPVCRELFTDADTPVSIYRKVAASRQGTFLLESAEQGGVFTRFSFVGAGSFGQLTERDGMAEWIPSDQSPISAERLLPGGVSHLQPVEALRQVMQHWRQAPTAGLAPLVSGFVGYLGWQTVRQFERLPEPSVPGPGIPSQVLQFVSELVVIDHREGSVVLVANALADQPPQGITKDADELWLDAQRRLDEMQRALSSQVASPLAEVDRTAKPEPTRLTSSAEFIAQVQRAQNYIVDGDIFQVVPSQRFDEPCSADPLDVYRVLRHLNPSPYLYLLQLHDAQGVPFSVVGSSPEALVTVHKDRSVLTHPIAGSRPRGASVDEDLQHERDLLADEKERAEHLMLVDLARNDLLRVCEPASVDVTEFMRIERFSHIMHISSTVEGTLRPEFNAVDALRSTFPAGTLSGAPKPRALEIIDELEPVQRGVYGGVVGYFGLAGSADLAIAIRTATIKDGVAMVQAGAGVVADSVAESEDAECASKAAAPLRAVAIANSLERLPAS